MAPQDSILGSRPGRKVLNRRGHRRLRHCPECGTKAARPLLRRRSLSSQVCDRECDFEMETAPWIIGIVGDRKSVVWGKSVDLGGRRIIKKKKSVTRSSTV